MGTVIQSPLYLSKRQSNKFYITQMMLALYLMVTILLFGSISTEPDPKTYLIETKDGIPGVRPYMDYNDYRHGYNANNDYEMGLDYSDDYNDNNDYRNIRRAWNKKKISREQKKQY